MALPICTALAVRFSAGPECGASQVGVLGDVWIALPPASLAPTSIASAGGQLPPQARTANSASSRARRAAQEVVLLLYEFTVGASQSGDSIYTRRGRVGDAVGCRSANQILRNRCFLADMSPRLHRESAPAGDSVFRMLGSTPSPDQRRRKCCPNRYQSRPGVPRPNPAANGSCESHDPGWTDLRHRQSARGA
jgi:hypothetical protein